VISLTSILDSRGNLVYLDILVQENGEELILPMDHLGLSLFWGIFGFRIGWCSNSPWSQDIMYDAVTLNDSVHGSNLKFLLQELLSLCNCANFIKFHDLRAYNIRKVGKSQAVIT